MSIAQMLLPEFDQEMSTTRLFLERVPEDRPDWKPHPRSMTLARLAGHVAELPSWGVNALRSDSLDVQPPGGRPFEPGVMEARRSLLDGFDASVRECRSALAEASDEYLMKPWTLLAAGKPRATLPRLAVLRTFMLNHMIHHRAQLGVYLRMNDVPLPRSFGSTADEPGM